MRRECNAATAVLLFALFVIGAGLVLTLTAGCDIPSGSSDITIYVQGGEGNEQSDDDENKEDSDNVDNTDNSGGGGE